MELCKRFQVVRYLIRILLQSTENLFLLTIFHGSQNFTNNVNAMFREDLGSSILRIIYCKLSRKICHQLFDRKLEILRKIMRSFQTKTLTT